MAVDKLIFDAATISWASIWQQNQGGLSVTSGSSNVVIPPPIGGLGGFFIPNQIIADFISTLGNRLVGIRVYAALSQDPAHPDDFDSMSSGSQRAIFHLYVVPVVPRADGKGPEDYPYDIIDGNIRPRFYSTQTLIQNFPSFSLVNFDASAVIAPVTDIYEAGEFAANWRLYVTSRPITNIDPVSLFFISRATIDSVISTTGYSRGIGLCLGFEGQIGIVGFILGYDSNYSPIRIISGTDYSSIYLTDKTPSSNPNLLNSTPQVDPEDARRETRNWRETNPQAFKGFFVSDKDISKLNGLSETGNEVGYRFYNALETNGDINSWHLYAVRVVSNPSDPTNPALFTDIILTPEGMSAIYDFTQPCPDLCGGVNILNSSIATL